MILMNDSNYELVDSKYEIEPYTNVSSMRTTILHISYFRFRISLLLATCALLFSSCGIYKFNDVGSIPPNVKTVKVNFIENKANYVNPQLSPVLTQRLQQKIINQTRLTRTNSDDAHYQISGYISNDMITTAGISNQTAATNRLTISVHIVIARTLENKTDEFDVSRNFDFPATLSRQQAEQRLQDEIMRTLTDEIFNHIFSNW